MQGCLLTRLTVVIAAGRVIINQLATCGPPSSSTLTDSASDNNFWMLAVHELITDHQLVRPTRCKIKPILDINIYTKQLP